MGVSTMASQESVPVCTASSASPKRVLIEKPAIDLDELAVADRFPFLHRHERAQAHEAGGVVRIVARKWYSPSPDDEAPLTSDSDAAPLAVAGSVAGGLPMKVNSSLLFDSIVGGPRKVKILSAPPGLDPPAPDLGGTGFEGNHVTTVMLRNLDSRFTQEDVAKILDGNGMGDKYDFIYLPRVHQRAQKKGQPNFGYTFVNFTEPEYATECYVRFHGQPFGSASGRLCGVGPARVQGSTSAIRNLAKKQKQNRGPLAPRESKDAAPQGEGGSPTPPCQ
mmetsp:Transcript_115904/g.328470  ORF Transcript_115904/g.328470 Transcript_115904/m.328470 type:complete len:278 (-) Transcript_115904:416-1249(-)